jgi:hypothetical protein
MALEMAVILFENLSFVTRPTTRSNPVDNRRTAPASEVDARRPNTSRQSFDKAVVGSVF